MVRHTGEYFINVEGVAEASVPSLQPAGINRTEFDTPKPNCFAADGNTAFREKVFDISVAEVESIVEPDGIGNGIGSKSVALISVYGPILAN
jgi:hypothetical protein